MPEPLLILGASVRAAAVSAARAGYIPSCGDLFCDLDLTARFVAYRCEDYPQGLIAIARRMPVGPWMYTGALGNVPELVDRLAAERVLYGNRGAGLRRVREPSELAAALAISSDVYFPQWADSADDLPRDGSWLQKLRRSAGGGHVRPLDEQNSRRGPQYYYQKRVAGLPCAALYVAADGRSRLLGVSEQWTGQAESLADLTGAHGFQYCGSLGPLPLDERASQQFTWLGDRLAGEFALSGVFGVDAMLDGGTVHVIEVNPRYPASAEVIEPSLCRKTSGHSVVGLHIEACRDGRLPAERASWRGPLYGKAILFAHHDCTTGEQLIELWRSSGQDDFSRLADVPPAGTLVRRGRPILTLLVSGGDRASVLQSLREKARQIRQSLLAAASQ